MNSKLCTPNGTGWKETLIADYNRIFLKFWCFDLNCQKCLRTIPSYVLPQESKSKRLSSRSPTYQRPHKDGAKCVSDSWCGPQSQNQPQTIVGPWPRHALRPPLHQVMQCKQSATWRSSGFLKQLYFYVSSVRLIPWQKYLAQIHTFTR